MNEKLYTVNEAAEYLKYNPETIRIWIRKGLLKAHKINNSRKKGFKIKESELNKIQGGF